jgi:uncharacterized protein with beta-barrel porin domain
MKPINDAVRTRTAIAPKLPAQLRIGRSFIIAAPPALSLVAVLAGSPAAAACLQSGNSVTCSGTTNTGFGTGAENNLAVTVQPDASINVGAAQKAINLGNGNTAINNGGIVVGNGGTGMQGLNNNIFTNNGVMTVGAASVGLFAIGNNNVLANTGTINSTGLSSVGIDLLGAGHTVTNSGTISLTGTASYGIAVEGTTILNSGVITVGGGAGATNGSGIWLGSNDRLTNTGTVTAAGVNGIGLNIGDGNTVTNSGLIRATGDSGIGAGFSGANNTVVNNGTISGGSNGTSLFSFGTTFSAVTNNGTLDGQISVWGMGNSLTNAGLITITDPGTVLGALDLSFGGTFTQTAQGTLALRVDNKGLHDGLVADGKANLNGALRAVLQPGLYGSSTTYKDVLVSSTSVAGQFASVTSSSAFFGAAATYNASSVDLTLTRYGFGSVPGETLNQRSIGSALEAGYSTALTGAAATFYTRLLQAGSLRVLDQLSGEGTSGTQNTAFNSGSLFGQTMNSQMEAWRVGNRNGVTGDAALGYAGERPSGPASAFAMLKAPAMVQPQWNAWAAGFGAGQSLAGNASTGSASFNDRAAGGSMGVDHLVNPDLLLGIAAGGSSATFSVDDRTTSGRLEGGHVGAYAMQRFGASYLSAQIAYSHFNNTTTRTISGIGPDETARGTFAVVAGRLCRDQHRGDSTRRARAKLCCARCLITADLPRRHVRRTGRPWKRNRMDAVCACRLGARIRAVPRDISLADQRAGSGVHHRGGPRCLRCRTAGSRIASCAQSLVGIVSARHRRILWGRPELFRHRFAEGELVTKKALIAPAPDRAFFYRASTFADTSVANEA